MSEIPIRVWRVGRTADSKYLMVLRDDTGSVLPMEIGPCEFVAIWSALRREAGSAESYESRTHDLLCSLIERLGGRLTKVVIDDLWNQVYYARLHLAVDGKAITIDARPSDSVAIALRLHAPLFVSPLVLGAASRDEDQAGARWDREETEGDLDDL